MLDIRHWLLDAAVERGVDLRTVAATNVSETLNRKTHGLVPEAVAQALADLAENGEIAVYRDFAREAPVEGVKASSLLEMLTEPRDSGHPSFYKLTPEGGGAWEAWAKPQWSRYNASGWRNDKKAILAATASVAEQLLELEAHLEHQQAIVPGSIRRRAFPNWQATYWKSLPQGHLIAFRTRPIERREWAPMSHREWARWVDLRNFYLRPADCGF